MAIVYWCDLTGEYCGRGTPILIDLALHIVQVANETFLEFVHWYEVFPMVGC